ncbi:MAG: 2-oxoglutarate dehydrogenase E1 component, partial [Deltaproteobacteria bacterium]|nr:2-oxoglutarate dehydrogenase E1 component [Deltaproteobacteria bacterium]
MTTYLNPANAAYIDGLLQEFESDPVTLDPTWRSFFEGMRYSDGQEALGAEDLAFELKALQLVQAYRTLGHLIADINPLDRTPKSHPLLEPSRFELTESDLDRPVKASALLGFEEETTLGNIIAFLRQIYCSTVAVEYGHIDDAVSRQWVQERVESGILLKPLDAELQKRVLLKLTETEVLEHLLHTRFVGHKRFSGEGNDVMIPMTERLIEICAQAGANELIFGTAHRGRLSLLAFVFQKDVKSIFAEFLGNLETETTPGDGDVKYHLGHSGNITTSNEKTVHLSLVPNPSHLEAVNPVVMGIVRAKQKLKNDIDRSQTIPVLMHGDASFAGQGIIYETLNMSELPGYTIGGTIHLIINNQIGFTALPRDGRSTPNATDIAKMLQAPIIRVNADEPDAAIRAMELATQYRITFKRDVFIDLIGYRRYGHNEGDEPAFTQPTMVQKIMQHPRVLEQYAARLTAAGVLTSEDMAALQQKVTGELEARLTETRSMKISKRADAFADRWRSLKPIPTGDVFFAPTETAIAKKRLLDLSRQLITLPKTFHPHPKIVRFLSDRQEMLEEKRGLDWGMGEALAYASLIEDGVAIRLAGQDSERGTFSHRHSVLHDAETGHRYVPLNNLTGAKADYEVLNSLLSEYAAMGFEFGQTLADPNKLVLWEAQFGDFANGAQIVIDQFLVGSAVKWQRYSGLVLL